jgi:hypothetical protein
VERQWNNPAALSRCEAAIQCTPDVHGKTRPRQLIVYLEVPAVGSSVSESTLPPNWLRSGIHPRSHGRTKMSHCMDKTIMQAF